MVGKENFISFFYTFKIFKHYAHAHRLIVKIFFRFVSDKEKERIVTSYQVVYRMYKADTFAILCTLFAST